MKRFSFAVYIILQCTWGLLQTLVGAVFFLISIRYKHSFYHGAILTERPGLGGVSLGLFIFVSSENGEEYLNKTSVHEFGHTIQSLFLGPFYLPVIGVISGLWCSLPYFNKLRKEKNIPYSACFTESWADECGKRFLNRISHY